MNGFTVDIHTPAAPEVEAAATAVQARLEARNRQHCDDEGAWLIQAARPAGDD